MIRVLHVVGKMNRGGIETFIMNVYRNLNREKIQFDFLLSTNEECDYNSEIKKWEEEFIMYHRERKVY